MTEKLRHVLQKFDEAKDNIKLLVEEDPEFLALCEDYGTCVEALQYWEHSEEPEAETRVKEYRILLEELEEEIREALEPRGLDRSIRIK